jgi:hypothetical protein
MRDYYGATDLCKLHYKISKNSLKNGLRKWWWKIEKRYRWGREDETESSESDADDKEIRKRRKRAKELRQNLGRNDSHEGISIDGY